MMKNGYVVDCLYLKYFIALLICSVYFIKAENYTYDLAVSAIFRNEARFMKEWIEFHKLVGVQHFYLYNHFSTDNYLEVLQPYIDNGEVDLVDWKLTKEKESDYKNLNFGSHYFNQWLPQAHNNCVKKVVGIVKWLAIIDLDEFLFPVQKMNLVDFLKDYEEFGGVRVNWVMFGTSHIDKIPDDKLMIECLTMCDPNGHRLKKSIVRPERVAKIADGHLAKYKKGFFHVNSDKKRKEASNSDSSYIVLDKVRINHYWTGDGYRFLNLKFPNQLESRCLENEYINKLEFIKKSLNRASDWNQAEDLTIHKYLDALKEKMKD